MNVSKFLSTALGVGIACAVLAPGANAQIQREQTTFQVTEPTEVGNQVLEPGTYKIRIKQVEQDANRSFVQVTDQGGAKVYATALATPHPRTESAAIPESEFMFYPATAGHPRALRSWFASGTMTGQDIVYPKERALELAQANQVTVPSVTVTEPEEMKTAEVTHVGPTKVEEAPPAPKAEAQVAEARPPEPKPEELPRTAGELPLLLGLGLVWLAGATGLRAARRHAA